MQQPLSTFVVALALVLAQGASTPSSATDRQAERAGPRPSLLVVGSNDNPPYLSADAQGNPQGFTAELLAAIAREAGFDLRFELVPRRQRVGTFRTGRGDVTGLELNTPAAAGTVPLVPLWQTRELVLFTSPRHGPVSLDTLAGETIAVLEATSQHTTLERLPADRRPSLVPVGSIDVALRKLRAGEVTAVFAPYLSVKWNPEYARSPRLAEYALRELPYMLVAREGREDLQPVFAAAYLRLQESGELNAIIERTLMTPPHQEARSAAFVTMTVLGVGGLALLGMVLWSASLRREVQRRTQELHDAAERQSVHAHILSQVADAIVITDIEGVVVSWNAGAASVFGRPPTEAIGQPLATLITNRLAARREGDLHDALAARTDWRGDAEIVRPAGDTVFVEATLRGVTDEQGRPSGALLVAHDVDARRRAEIDAGIRARQQAAIASLGQRALAGIDFGWLRDQAASMLANTLQVPAVALFELAHGNTLVMRAGEGWTDARPGETRVAVERTKYPALAFAAEGGVAPLDRRSADAPVIDLLHIREAIVAGVAVVIPGRSGPYGLLVAGDRRDHRFSRDDIHFLQAIANVIGAAYERSLIDGELRAELTLHNATLEAAADGILVTDAAGRVRRYNQRLVTMWGFPPEVLATPDVEAWVRWSAAQLEERESGDFHDAGESALPQNALVRLKDGRTFERQSHPQLVDGKVDGRVWCYRDITDRVRAEEERLRLEAQMQHVQKLESLGVLAGGIAHDFNNLLVGMLGHAGLALGEIDAESPARDRIVQIQTTAQRAAELTNQMLAYSGKGRFVLQSADLSDLVGEMTHLLRTAVAKNAEIVLDLAPSLPAFDGDPAQIRQVIMNLITNASDAIGNTPGTITIETGRQTVTRAELADAWVGGDIPEGDYVYAEVRDTGCGMDAATLARIFDPFFTTKFTGRGLGLAAVLGIVRGHKGAIRIGSEEGRGTTFRVLLPATAAAVQAPAKAASVRATPARAAGGRILVVDDEPGVRTIARESLRRAGYEVVTANDGAEAIEVLRGDGAFSAVLLDMTMPRMNGTEAMGLIREMHPGMPVVLTSGYSAQDAVGHCDNDGIAGFIQKPFMPAALVKAINEAVTRGPRREVA